MEYHAHRFHNDHHSGITSDSGLVAAIMMTAYFWYFPPSEHRQTSLLIYLFGHLACVLCCVGLVCWKHLSEYGLLHKRIGLLHCISTDKTCSKGRRTPLSSWAITDLTIILLLGAIYQVYTWGSAATTTKRSGHTVVVVVQVQMQNGTGLKKRFSRSVFYWAGLLAYLLARQLGQGHV